MQVRVCVLPLAVANKWNLKRKSHLLPCEHAARIQIYSYIYACGMWHYEWYVCVCILLLHVMQIASVACEIQLRSGETKRRPKFGQQRIIGINKNKQTRAFACIWVICVCVCKIALHRVVIAFAQNCVARSNRSDVCTNTAAFMCVQTSIFPKPAATITTTAKIKTTTKNERTTLIKSPKI